MTQLSLDDRLAPNSHVVMRELGGEAVILDMKSGVYFGLNGVGTRVWNVVANGGSLRDVQLLAGHQSIQTTQRYIDGDTDAQRRLVALL